MRSYDFENSIGFIVNRTARAFVKALDSELRYRTGVTFGQWKIMVMLVNQNGLTQKEIADRLDLEGPTLIPIIDKMEKEGLVIRKVDTDDRRNNRICRTDKADKLWDKMLECALKIRQISVKDIPEEDINTMRNVLDKIWQNLRLNFDVYDTVVDNMIVDSTSSGPLNKSASLDAIDEAIASTRRKK
jgi:MarR family transcriptional regulator, transcriptional regulator for hemolysin